MNTENELFLVSYNETSRRHAILSDEGHAAFLYLHQESDDPNKTAPVDGDVIAYNKTELIEVKEVKSYRPNSPPIAKGYGHEGSVIKDPSMHEWELRWSEDGLSVLLLKDDEPWCTVRTNQERGYSKAISTDGPWGQPWENLKTEGLC